MGLLGGTSGGRMDCLEQAPSGRCVPLSSVEAYLAARPSQVRITARPFERSSAILETSSIAHGGTGLSSLSQRCTVRSASFRRAILGAWHGATALSDKKLSRLSHKGTTDHKSHPFRL